MIRKAVGTVMSRIAVTATTNRTRGRFAPRKSRMFPPNATRTMTSGTRSAARTAIVTTRIRPTRVRWLPVRPSTAVMYPSLGPKASRSSGSDHSEAAHGRTVAGSLVHATHDRVERGHHGHRVGDQ